MVKVPNRNAKAPNRNATTKRRRRPTKPKELRNNLKNWADGVRNDVLMPHIEAYADARVRGWKAERTYFDKVCDEYHAVIDWRLKDHEEPPLPLPPYNPNAPPAQEVLSREEQVAKLERIEVLNARIHRWLTYRFKKLQRMCMGGKDPRKNPFLVLMAKLSGVHAPPKARQSYQQFMKERYREDIAPVVLDKWAEHVKRENLPPNASPDANFRGKVARDMFQKLSPDAQNKFSKAAKQEAMVARDLYEKEMSGPVSLTPKQIQKCIDNLPEFLWPIIQGIQERTGFKFFIMYGGPVPRNDGEVTAYCINYGSNKEEKTFPRFKDSQFNNVIYPSWVSYLESCYNEEDKAQVALNGDEDNGKEGKEATELDETDSSSSSSESESDSDDEDRPSPQKRARTDSTHPLSSTNIHPLPKQQRLSTSAFKACFADLNTQPPPTTSTSRDGSSTKAFLKAVSSPTTPVIAVPRNSSGHSQQQIPTTASPATVVNHSPAIVPGAGLTPPPRPQQDASSSIRRPSHPPPSSSLPPASVIRHLSVPPQRSTPEPYHPTTGTQSASSSIRLPSHPPPSRSRRVVSTMRYQSVPPQTSTPRPFHPTYGAQSTSSLSLKASTTSSHPAARPMMSNSSTLSTQRANINKPFVSKPIISNSSPLSAPPVTSHDAFSSAGHAAITPPIARRSLLQASVTPPASQETHVNELAPFQSAAPPPASQETRDNELAPISSAAPPPASQVTHVNEFVPFTSATPLTTPPAATTSSVPSPLSTTPTSAPTSSALAPNTITSAKPTCPSDAADWFKKAFASVNIQGIDAALDDILRALCRIEASYHYQNPPRGLSTANRPKELDKWIGAGCWRGKAPIINDPVSFSAAWWAWWMSLQPAWRESSLSGRPAPGKYGDDWSKLKFPGQNGILSVVATLVWWSLALSNSPQHGPGSRADWLEGVQDVTWMLQGLVAQLG